MYWACVFLSTLSLRRATPFKYQACKIHCISIHALLAESDLVQIAIDDGANISIHALLAESDIVYRFCSAGIDISIHALLAESDGSLRAALYDPQTFLSTLSLRRATYSLVELGALTHNFYPRSPCGERPVSDSNFVISFLFLSTLSLRRATPYLPLCENICRDFYPRSPCGERQTARFAAPLQVYFYPRSPCGERLERLPNGVGL